MKSFLTGRWRHGFSLAFVVLLTGVVFVPAVTNDFTSRDANTHLTENPAVRSLSPKNILRG